MATLKITPELEKIIVDFAYPVGSLYISTNNVDPSTLYSGTKWTRIAGQYLMGFDPSTSLDHKTCNVSLGGWNIQTGAHTISVDEMPEHRHFGVYVTGIELTLNSVPSGSTINIAGAGNSGTTGINNIYTAPEGKTQPHSHPLNRYPVPTRTFNVWYRTA